MPLSEHEQRILAELEESLVRHDPEFAQRVRSEPSAARSSRDIKWAIAAFVVGLAILVVFYSWSVLAGLAGVVVMFVALVVLERNLRRTGKVAWPDFSQRHGGEVESGQRDWRTRLFRRDR